MRAQEVELQRVVDARDGADRWLGLVANFAVATRRVGTCHVEEDPPRDGDEPSGRIGGWVVLPRGERACERLLYGVLGRREVGTATAEDAQHMGNELTKLEVDRRHCVTFGGSAMNGRSSNHSWIGSPLAPGAADSS